MAADVVLYRTPWCGFCVRAAELLGKKGVPFKEVDVSDDMGRRRWLAQVTGQRTVPQIFINDRPIGGCTELFRLERAGTLDGMLAEGGAGGAPE